MDTSTSTEPYDPFTGLTEAETTAQDLPLIQVLRDRIHDATGALAAVTHINDDATGQELAEAFAEIKTLASVVREVEALINAEGCQRSIKGDEYDNDTQTVYVTTKAKSEKWDHGLLLPNVLEEIRGQRQVDPTTGEMETADEAYARQLPTVYSMTPSAKPKKTGLAGLGIDVDKYRTVEWGGLTMRIKDKEQS